MNYFGRNEVLQTFKVHEVVVRDRMDLPPYKVHLCSMKKTSLNLLYIIKVAQDK
jgi:hypothetical protein